MIFSYAQRRKQTVYYFFINIWVRAYYFYSPRNQTTFCQYNNTTSAAHYRVTIDLAVLESKYNIGNRVLSQNKISVLVVAHSCFNSYNPNSYLYFIHRFISKIKFGLVCTKSRLFIKVKVIVISRQSIS